MPDVDDELIARTIRWCADAGRHTTPRQVRAVLGGLSWDELLATRALLADPPPARPLGPSALADIARGAAPELAAEREHEGRYPAAESESGEILVEASQPAPARARAPRSRKAAGPVIRRARDRVEPAGEAPQQLPLVDELFASEGRALLQRLMRDHGARRGPILRALEAGWRHGDATPLNDSDLARLLDLHGLSRAFESRERDELLHALRAAGGVMVRAAAQVGLSPEGFRSSLERLGAGREADSIRGAHRMEISKQATLSERARLLLEDRERLTDLELLPALEADLRARLPEHIRAVRASGATPLLPALARSLALSTPQLARLGSLLGLELEGPGPASPPDRGQRGARRPSTRPARSSPRPVRALRRRGPVKR